MSDWINKDTYQTIKQASTNMVKPNEPIWFKENQKDTSVTTFNIGARSPHKIMICTPVHSDVSMHYCQAVLKMQQECMKRNILVSFTLMKSSLVTQGRNLCVAEFLNHEDKYTHLLFIDSDIDFNFSTIEKMLEADKDIISCPYPMKQINWDKAWRRLTHKEGAISDANDLAKAGYTFPVKLENSAEIIVDKGLIEATHAPTGCMLIKRQVIEKLIKAHPELEIFQPTNMNGKEVKKENFYNLFDTLHEPDTKRYFGEDFGFCQRWTNLGGKVYLFVTDYITHIGEYQYCGRFLDDLKQGTTPSKPVDDPTKIK
jgi:hypothetical protein